MRITLISKWQMLARDHGFIICFLLSLVVLICFFGNVLFHANSVYFGNSGDAMQTYYNSVYHVLYDKSYVYQEAMNYPYQESVFFTACHPAITGLIKVLGLNAWTVGIINVIVLLLLPAGAWCLYFVFKDLGVNRVVGAIAAVAIAYLSPQVARLNSHCTLSYCFAIPVIIYLALRFYNSPTFKRSFLIAVLVFFMASTHMYFFVFYALILTWVWIAYFYVNGFKSSLKTFFKHYSIQVILPFVLIQVMVFLLTEYTDRTKSPAGFLENTSNWSGVFYPYDRFYAGLFSGIRGIPTPWEGLAYVGLGACLGFTALVLGILFRLARLKFKSIFSFTSSPFLNALLVCALLSLFYSFGWPYVFGHEDWVDKIGFLKQIRALGRFAWIFYYIINIALMVMITEIPAKYDKIKLKAVVTSLVLLFLCYDAYVNIKNCNTNLNNKFAELSDIKNKLPGNKWLERVNVNDFQAILPLPWFHVGSENFYFPAENGMDINSYIVALKTGLPIIAVMGSRVSLEQTFNNLELVREPTGKIPAILNKFNNKKDILLVVTRDSLKSSYEKAILSKGTFIAGSDRFILNRLKFDSLSAYYKQHARNKIKAYKEEYIYTKSKYQSNDSTHNYIAGNFSSNENENDFLHAPHYSGISKNYFVIFNDSLKQPSDDSIFTFSFWLNHIRNDQEVHQTLAIEAIGNGKIYTPVYSSAELHVKQLNGDWGLIECTFKLRKATDKIKVVLWNPKFDEKRKTVVDDILFKPERTNVYRIFPNFMLINNCVYYYD